MWKSKILDLNKDNPFSELNHPATGAQISEVSLKLKVKIPHELEELLYRNYKIN